jgi:hypothetical protein
MQIQSKSNCKKMAKDLHVFPLKRALIPVLCLFGFSQSPLYAQTWYNSDTHLHAQCAGITYSAAELLDLMKQEGINVGSVLVHGGMRSLEQDSTHFRGQEDDPVSEPNYILRWGIEIAQLPGAWNGHMIFLNVAQNDAVVPNQVNYPGQDYLLPNYQYVQSGGGIVGYAHGIWRVGSYSVPTPDWSGFARELPLDVALTKVDFLEAQVITDGLYWLWYSMLNAGFHLPVVGGSDVECYWPEVGKYHTAFPLPNGDALTYTRFIQAVREGRTVIRRNASPPDFLDIRVNGVGLGGQLILPNQATTVNVQVDASSEISGQRVELILNGEVIGSQALTNSVQSYQWPVSLDRSGWIAAKTTGPAYYPPAPGYTERPSSDGAHTAATFVLLGGCPIRNDPAAARKWRDYLEAYYQRGVALGEFGESVSEVRQKVNEAKLVWEKIAQEGEGSIAMDCKAFTINAGHSGAWFNPETPGQGQLIDVEPGSNFLFLSWFTFTEATADNPNEQQWYTAQGNYTGDTAVLDLFETLGGKFDDPQEVTTTQVGEVTLTFSDCDQGMMSYSFDAEELEGEFPLVRVIPGSDNVCEGLSGNNTEAVDINAGMDGAWFDSDTSGQGYFIDAHTDAEGGNFIFVSWFTYGDETASGQRWLTAQGGFEGSTAEIAVFETTGGSFDDPEPISTTEVGTMSIDFTDCSNAQLSYSLPADPVEGDLAITRVIPGGKALCEELAGAD